MPVHISNELLFLKVFKQLFFEFLLRKASQILNNEQYIAEVNNSGTRHTPSLSAFTCIQCLADNDTICEKAAEPRFFFSVHIYINF